MSMRVAILRRVREFERSCDGCEAMRRTRKWSRYVGKDNIGSGGQYQASKQGQSHAMTMTIWHAAAQPACQAAQVTHTFPHNRQHQARPRDAMTKQAIRDRSQHSLVGFATVDRGILSETVAAAVMLRVRLRDEGCRPAREMLDPLRCSRI